MWFLSVLLSMLLLLLCFNVAAAAVANVAVAVFVSMVVGWVLVSPVLLAVGVLPPMGVCVNLFA